MTGQLAPTRYLRVWYRNDMGGTSSVLLQGPSVSLHRTAGRLVDDHGKVLSADQFYIENATVVGSKHMRMNDNGLIEEGLA